MLGCQKAFITWNPITVPVFSAPNVNEPGVVELDVASTEERQIALLSL